MRVLFESVAVVVAFVVLWFSMYVFELGCTLSDPCGLTSVPIVQAVFGWVGVVGVVASVFGMRRGRGWAGFLGIATLWVYVGWLAIWVYELTHPRF